MAKTKASAETQDTEANTNQVPNLRYSITKSNRLIQAQYKCSVLEEKIVYAALYAAQNKSFVETDEGYEVIISPNELREMTGYKGGSFYSKLQPAAQALTQRVYGIEDPENDRFEYINLISRSVYDKGEFKITFNRTQRNLILNLTTNFTQLPVLMMKLKNVYAFRLYELLRSECYYRKSIPKAERTNTFFLSHSVSELKLALGVVDASERDVRKVLSSKNPDYDMAVAKAKDSMYSVNGNFTRDVIAKAVKEINTKLDMKIEYKTRKKGSQLHDIDFVVTMEDKKREQNCLNFIARF
jgi:plasmid replication initiation protein